MTSVGLAEQDWGCAIGYAVLLSCYLRILTMSNVLSMFLDSVINRSFGVQNTGNFEVWT